MAPKLTSLERPRYQKMEELRAAGIDPFGQRFDDHRPIADVREECPAESGELGPEVRIAGRILTRRKAGKLRFYDVKDQTGRIQLLFSKGDLPEDQWDLMGKLDLGDLVGIDGRLKRTDMGEVSIAVGTLTILGKSMSPPPEKHHGIEDIETRLRQRSLDLIYTDGVLDRMLQRSAIIDSVRQTLREHGFHEVETPVLHAIAGGAAARPFETHHNALDIPLFMRIALELHLKRLMVGGIERVYEIGRVFRNEGIDATHNPEFTMLEAYRAYGDYETMMDLTEAIVVGAARAVRGERSEVGDQKSEQPSTLDPCPLTPFEWADKTIDFTPPWPRRKYHDLFREHVGVDPADHDAVRAKGREAIPEGKIDVDGAHIDVVVSELFEEFVEPNLVGPVFVIDYPASICPLTKRKQDDDTIAERFELFVHGMELANAYTELNDPWLQQELFETQLEGLAEEESMAKMDHEFIKALKIGMPPAGGLGIGIDRLVMLLTNSQTIRDVIFFPLLRPEQREVPKKAKQAKPFKPRLSSWAIQIAGDEFDLKRLADACSSDDVTILGHESGFHLESRTFASLETAEAVLEAGKEIVEQLNGIAILLLDSRTRLSLSSVVRVDDDGRKSLFVATEETIRCRDSLEITVHHRDGSSERMSEGAPANDWFALARVHNSVREVFRLVSHASLSWSTLAKILELVQEDAGGVVNQGWMTQTAYDRLKHTANHPESAGLDARHAVMKQSPPSRPMEFGAASALVKATIQQWLASKLQPEVGGPPD